MPRFIGIDLGTTFSAVAVFDDTGRSTIVTNTDGDNITPSVVSFTGTQSVLVGEEARKLLDLDDHTLGRFKRDMGEKEVTYQAGGKNHNPTSLSAFVLKKLKDDSVPPIAPDDQVVITVPASFEHHARAATKAAAQNAGLKVKQLINEPTAAAIYFAVNKTTPPRGNYVVFDLGGGTFDVTVLHLSGDKIRTGANADSPEKAVNVLASEGASHLGGDDFDKALQKIVQARYYDETGETLEPIDFTTNEAEETKKTLSKKDQALVSKRSSRGRTVITVTRNEFEEAISDKIVHMRKLCECAIKTSGIDIADIEGVILAGGSTRIPRIQELARTVFNQEPILHSNVDEIVALGAAVFAAYTSRDQLNPVQKGEVDKLEVQEVSKLFLGTLAQEDNRAHTELIERNSILIMKGDKLPAAKTRAYYTLHDGQTSVGCEVTECAIEETNPQYVNIIWKGALALPPGRPKGQRIDVTYKYRADQTLYCEFLDVATGTRTVADTTIGSPATQQSDIIEEFTVE